MSVMIYDLVQAIYSWVENISVHSKAVSRTLTKRGYCATKTIEVYELVAIVILQNAPD